MNWTMNNLKVSFTNSKATKTRTTLEMTILCHAIRKVLLRNNLTKT